jgi:hypothetical protein
VLALDQDRVRPSTLTKLNRVDEWNWNGVVADVVGGVSTTSAGSPSFTADRFGNVNGAANVNSLSNGYNLPAGVYLSNDFTISVWVKSHNCASYNSICKF